MRNQLALIERWPVRYLSFDDCLYLLGTPHGVLLFVRHQDHASGDLPRIETWLNVALWKLPLEVGKVILCKPYVKCGRSLELCLQVAALHTAEERWAWHLLEVVFATTTVLAGRRISSITHCYSLWLDRWRVLLGSFLTQVRVASISICTLIEIRQESKGCLRIIPELFKWRSWSLRLNLTLFSLHVSSYDN